MVSRHYKSKRYKREKFIDKHLNGDGKVIDSFIVDKGHEKGLERHDVTENGIIIIYNSVSNKLITKLVARENQIKRYYHNSGREPPEWLLYLARYHESLRYNR
ncbi:MAG: hypothetical protein J6R59_10140 [Paludibacteraceae bacterium]|nr:hypothetical protein [Paludibacteraceae bacterium]